MITKKHSCGITVSSCGRVFGVKGERNPSSNGKYNYQRLTVGKRGEQSTQYIHRLVAECFIPNPDNKPCVNHIDGNKLNNDVSNLEWCTISENHIHAMATGLKANCPAKGQQGFQYVSN